MFDSDFVNASIDDWLEPSGLVRDAERDTAIREAIDKIASDVGADRAVGLVEAAHRSIGDPTRAWPLFDRSSGYTLPEFSHILDFDPPGDIAILD